MTEGGEHEDYVHAVTELLLKLGFQAGTKGYRYLRDAVVEECKGLENTASMTKQLYPMLAERYAVTNKQVERAIRCAIESVWAQRDEEVWRGYLAWYDYTSDGRPTNKELIDMLTDIVKRSAAHEEGHQYRSTCI